MTIAVLERKLRPLSEPVSNKFLQFLLMSFPATPIRGARTHKHYSSAIAIVLEALERGKLHGETRKAAERFIEILAPVIAEYERKAFPIPRSKPGAILEFLMQQHGLKQNDLADELGGQSVVSELLRGKRRLNVEQIQKLCRRFNVSPAVFFPDTY